MVKSEKILIETEKRALKSKQDIIALKLDVAGYKMLKNCQYKVLVKDIDNLLDMKTNFDKKTDLLSGKVDEVSTLAHSKISELCKKFE